MNVSYTSAAAQLCSVRLAAKHDLSYVFGHREVGIQVDSEISNGSDRHHRCVPDSHRTSRKFMLAPVRCASEYFCLAMV